MVWIHLVCFQKGCWQHSWSTLTCRKFVAYNVVNLQKPILLKHRPRKQRWSLPVLRPANAAFKSCGAAFNDCGTWSTCLPQSLSSWLSSGDAAISPKRRSPSEATSALKKAPYKSQFFNLSHSTKLYAMPTPTVSISQVSSLHGLRISHISEEVHLQPIVKCVLTHLSALLALKFSDFVHKVELNWNVSSELIPQNNSFTTLAKCSKTEKLKDSTTKALLDS